MTENERWVAPGGLGPSIPLCLHPLGLHPGRHAGLAQRAPPQSRSPPLPAITPSSRCPRRDLGESGASRGLVVAGLPAAQKCRCQALSQPWDPGTLGPWDATLGLLFWKQVVSGPARKTDPSLSPEEQVHRGPTWGGCCETGVQRPREGDPGQQSFRANPGGPATFTEPYASARRALLHHRFSICRGW